MRKKLSKIILSILLPVVMVLTAGILSFTSITSTAHALSGNGGGFYVGKNSTFNFTRGSISGMTATNGGGVYVANGGTFNMSGGSIFGNKATSNGDNIYNNGTFIMTGGTIGETGGNGWVYCDRSAVTQIYGGTVHDNFYMYSNLQTKMGATINGKIFLAETNTITVEDYNGTTPEYNIELLASRVLGPIVTFKGNTTTSPDISKFTVTGYNSDYDIVIRKNSNGYFELALTTLELPSTWQTEVASTTYMTTTVTPANITKIQFVATVPSGYTKIGTLSTGLPVYKGTTATEIAFVGKKIFAPVNSLYLFKDLKKLTTIDFAVFKTDNVTTMAGMFYNCSSLTSLDVSSFNTTKVTAMVSMFYNCLSLTSLDVSNFNTTNVTNMYGMFYNCSKLASLDLSKFDTSKVTDMSSMFNGCSGLTSIDVSKFDTSKVTSMMSMFSGCSNLTSLDLSNLDTSKVTKMSHMFSRCSKLASLDLRSFNMLRVTACDYMLNFGTSNKIETLKTPYKNNQVLPITTGSTLYNDETGDVVTSVPANTVGSLTYTNVPPFKTFPTTWRTEVASSTYMTSTLTVLSIKRIFFPTTLDSAFVKIGTLSTGIGVYKSSYNSDYIAFYTGKKIYMPENSTQLFYNLNAERMSFESVDTTKTTNMTQMFANCTSLLILDLSTFNMSSVSTVDNMLKFGTSAPLGRILTPYGNKTAIAITAGSTLYDVSTGSMLTANGVLAHSTASKTLAKKVTVSFDPYNGTAVSPSSATAYFGDKYSGTVPSTTRSGYTFQGWYTAISGGTSISTYVLLGNTTFFAHWAENSGGGGGGGTTDPDPNPDPDPTFPDAFELKHERSELDGETLDEEGVVGALDIFNSALSNTFTAEEITAFSIISTYDSNQLNEYSVNEEYGNVGGDAGGVSVARVENTGSQYSFLMEQDWILSFYCNTAAIGFDQWYYFDSMLFYKIGELFPNLKILDLRGLNTDLVTLSFKLPDSVEHVLLPAGCKASFFSNRLVDFYSYNSNSIRVASYETDIYQSQTKILGLNVSDLKNLINTKFNDAEKQNIYGFALISPASPEQFMQYRFMYVYGQINDMYLVSVDPTEFVSTFGNNSEFSLTGSVDKPYLALVNFNGPIFICQGWEAGGGFSEVFDSNMYIMCIDLRGMLLAYSDHSIENPLQIPADAVIMPTNYDGIPQIEGCSNIVKSDGTMYSFVSVGENDNSGLEIVRGKLYTLSAENVDIYIDDKKWFDPKKNKIQIKTENDGEE